MILDFALLQTILPKDTVFLGNQHISFNGMQSAFECKSGEVTWIKDGVRNANELLNSVEASGIICSPTTYKNFVGDKTKKLFMLHTNPQLLFKQLVKHIYDTEFKQNENLNIHPTAIVHPDCTIGKNVRIGAYSIIGACEIGDNVTIHEHVKIYDCATIGNDCLIREFCSIGGEGFGFIKNSEGHNEHIPHIGKVIIENNVSIFPFSNVDRGTLGTTLIKSFTVIDHYVHIGHNSKVGKNNMIAAGTVLAGGSEIKDNCFIGVQTTIKDSTVIGSNVFTGMGTRVLKDIPDNEIWVGNPGRFLRKNDIK